jgi:hypothetical protein
VILGTFCGILGYPGIPSGNPGPPPDLGDTPPGVGNPRKSADIRGKTRKK